MIALLIASALAAQSVPSGDTALGPIGKQALPAKGCAAFLWSAAGDRQLVAMAVADPAMIRLSIDGRTVDLARDSQSGIGGFGFAETTSYRSTELTATLNLTIATRSDLSNGATVPQATLTIDRAGHDTVVLPTAGLIGCTT